MSAHPVHAVTDPETGERVSLRELAQRHGLTYSCVVRRNRRGLSGWELVEPVALAKRRAGIASAAQRMRKERQESRAINLTQARKQPLSRIRLT